MKSSLSAELRPAPVLVREAKIMALPNSKLQRLHLVYYVKGLRSTQLALGSCPALTMPMQTPTH